MVREAPRIETERLILREFRAGDLDEHAETLGDEEVMRHIGGKPMSREDSWRRLLSGVGMWSLVGMGPWAVELKSDGRMVGHCGFFQFNRELEPLILDEPEMGWIFSRSVHGQGIAFEACAAALEWAERELGADSYPAIIDLENAASMKLAERLGFVRQADGVYRDSPIAFYRRPGRL
ncbi:MAG TPA: GNAT family N-acetyltransferase [Sphingomicrobium sp.]|nr:GNAT family N-acetyltransferase [Sphingomicrobium sp.]